MASDLTNSEKAAVILMSLGKDQAAGVMKFLSETEVKKLSRAFMGVQEVGREAQREIAAEFHNMLRSAETVVVDGREFAKDVISSAFGDSAGESLLQYVTGSKKEPLSTLLGDIPEQAMENFLTTEHPQTVAFLLTKMAPELAAQSLKQLSDEIQTDVMLRISQLSPVKAEVIDEVREVLRGQLRGVGMREDEELGGPKAAADILNFVDRNSEQRIVSDIEEMYPDLAEEIRNLMFTFEDLAKIDERSIQTILKDVPRETLVIALKTASDAIKNLLFKNMSQRAAEMLKDDLDTLGPTKLKDVEKAQQAIIDIVRKLEAEGKIQIAGGGDDVLV